MASIASAAEAKNVAESTNDDDDFLQPSRNADKSDFLMGMSKPVSSTEGEATAAGDAPMEDETSKQIMFKLLARVGSDPEIPMDVLVTKNFVPLSDAIASDVEDGMSGHISETFVTCVKEFPTQHTDMISK